MIQNNDYHGKVQVIYT